VPPKRPSGRATSPGRRSRGRLRWLLFAVAGIAVTAGAGYLVAALVFFPAPLLPSERQVPRVMGLSETQARRELEGAGLVAEPASREPHPRVSAGIVTWQDPPPGVAAPRGSQVVLTVSTGTPRVLVPDVFGLDAELAQRLVLAAGLRVDAVDSLDDKRVPRGIAVRSEPAAGDSLHLGRGVILHLAR
jgi:serine/threonine-protein kinase